MARRLVCFLIATLISSLSFAEVRKLDHPLGSQAINEVDGSTFWAQGLGADELSVPLRFDVSSNSPAFFPTPTSVPN